MAKFLDADDLADMCLEPDIEQLLVPMPLDLLPDVGEVAHEFATTVTGELDGDDPNSAAVWNLVRAIDLAADGRSVGPYSELQRKQLARFGQTRDWASVLLNLGNLAEKVSHETVPHWSRATLREAREIADAYRYVVTKSDGIWECRTREVPRLVTSAETPSRALHLHMDAMRLVVRSCIREYGLAPHPIAVVEAQRRERGPEED